MSAPIFRLPSLFLLAITLSISVTTAPAAQAALSPQSPEVQRAIGRAVKYLEELKSPDDRMGAHAIRATVILKAGGSENHPIVQSAVREIRKDLPNLKGVPKDHIIYSVSLSLIFFCTLDPDRYKPEIDRLLQYLLSVQKAHGGWGYEDQPTGDTSMTQHCILALWEAAETGFAVPQAAVERAATWFLKTQDPSGAFGYQGEVSESFVPVKQTELRHSCAAAGMGSVYMCAELLGIGEKLGQRSRDEAKVLPALTKIETPGNGNPLRFSSRLDAGLFRTVMGRGNQWLEQNHTVHPDMWPYYFLYSIERYWTFRELIDGDGSQVNRWYDEAARWLLEVQNADGSWFLAHISTNMENHTCFATLFLLRSTKKSVEKVRAFESGTLVGGRGLPKDSDLVQIRGGKVVSSTEFAELEKILSDMGDASDEEYAKAIGALSELAP
ncbi:MAG: hypothetical protein ACYC6Y_28160, partial [Thermoguttaceae bacterium]